MENYRHTCQSLVCFVNQQTADDCQQTKLMTIDRQWIGFWVLQPVGLRCCPFFSAAFVDGALAPADFRAANWKLNRADRLVAFAQSFLHLPNEFPVGEDDRGKFIIIIIHEIGWVGKFALLGIYQTDKCRIKTRSLDFWGMNVIYCRFQWDGVSGNQAKDKKSVAFVAKSAVLAWTYLVYETWYSRK